MKSNSARFASIVNNNTKEQEQEHKSTNTNTIYSNKSIQENAALFSAIVNNGIGCGFNSSSNSSYSNSNNNSNNMDHTNIISKPGEVITTFNNCIESRNEFEVVFEASSVLSFENSNEQGAAYRAIVDPVKDKANSKFFIQSNGDSDADADSEFNFENYYSKKTSKKEKRKGYNTRQSPIKYFYMTNKRNSQIYLINDVLY